MNELALNFNYNGLKVRTLYVKEVEEIVWFSLKDICDILGIKNSRDVFNRLDEDEKGVDFIDTLGGKQEMQVINEFGLYDTILRSNSEKAKPFRRWITHEVIPSIRKQGYYSLYSDEQTIELIYNKVRKALSEDSLLPIDKRPTILDKINKTEIKSEIKKELKDEKYKQIQSLWDSDFKDTSPAEFMHKLQSICKGDSALFHKYWDLYNKQKDPKFRGVVMV